MSLNLHSNITDELKWMKKAYHQALRAYKKKEVPVGAILVQKNKIIARAFNLKENKNCALEHAEIRVIQKASFKLKKWRLNDCELFVTLEPCAMCASALGQARVKKVYFGAYDFKGGALSLNMKLHSDPRLNHRFEMQYVPFLESELLLKKFFKELRNKKK